MMHPGLLVNEVRLRNRALSLDISFLLRLRESMGRYLTPTQCLNSIAGASPAVLVLALLLTKLSASHRAHIDRAIVIDPCS